MKSKLRATVTRRIIACALLLALVSCRGTADSPDGGGSDSGPLDSAPGEARPDAPASFP